MIKYMFLTILAVLLAACASGPKFSAIRNGMTMDRVQQIVGEPDETLTFQGNEVYKYVDRLVNNSSWDKADYYVVIDHSTNTVGKHGRENYRSAPRPVYVAPIYQESPAPLKLNCVSNTVGGQTYTDCN